MSDLVRYSSATEESPLSWETICEDDWRDYLHPSDRVNEGTVRRVYPDTPAYHQVVNLRYHGLVETGFLDPRTARLESMALERDSDSVIIGLFEDLRILATITLNIRTPRFPGLAMELEKGVAIDTPEFLGSRAMECSKFVVHPKARGFRSILKLLPPVIVVSQLFGRRYLWQVSRDIPGDRSWREGLGFDYTQGIRFIDRSLNNMPSCVGSLDLNRVLEKPAVPRLVRSIYRRYLPGATPSL
ncbi:MAG: N-acyl amino acid synthase FeeM domain-containing protein [Spirochaetota bacterium]